MEKLIKKHIQKPSYIEDHYDENGNFTHRHIVDFESITISRDNLRLFRIGKAESVIFKAAIQEGFTRNQLRVLSEIIKDILRSKKHDWNYISSKLHINIKNIYKLKKDIFGNELVNLTIEELKAIVQIDV